MEKKNINNWTDIVSRPMKLQTGFFLFASEEIENVKILSEDKDLKVKILSEEIENVKALFSLQ